MKQNPLVVAQYLMALAGVVVVGWTGWLALSSIFLRGSCPKCGWSNTRPSRPQSVLDWILRALSIGVFRCRTCRSRFYQFRRKTRVVAGQAHSAVWRLYEDGVGPMTAHSEPELEFHPATARPAPAKAAESTAWSTIQSYSQWHWTELTLSPRPPRG